MRNLTPIVEHACTTIGGSSEYWRHYFNNLCYDFNEKRQAGLALYFSYAFELGLIQNEVRMNIWNDNI
ncbi:Chorismate dehydratase [compost metagenome]